MLLRYMCQKCCCAAQHCELPAASTHPSWPAASRLMSGCAARIQNLSCSRLKVCTPTRLDMSHTRMLLSSLLLMIRSWRGGGAGSGQGSQAYVESAARLRWSLVLVQQQGCQCCCCCTKPSCYVSTAAQRPGHKAHGSWTHCQLLLATQVLHGAGTAGPPAPLCSATAVAAAAAAAAHLARVEHDAGHVVGVPPQRVHLPRLALCSRASAGTASEPLRPANT
jgi:hypothetical protein